MKRKNISGLSWETSLVLDGLRLCAAFIVFIHHGYSLWFSNAASDKLIYIAHFSVVIFFVLSGYLIAYTTSNNNRGALSYIQARLSRLYSVLIPAIIITALCQFTIFFINHPVFSEYSRPPIVIRYLLSASFLNEIWFYSSSPPINGPLWSMSYEFWYYTIFGIWVFSKKNWQSNVLLVLVIIIAGPSILLMMPIWLMGCLAYKLSRLKKSDQNYPILFCGCIIASILLLSYLPPMPFNLGQYPFHYANQFITDNIIGIFVAGSLFCETRAKSLKQTPDFIKKFRKIADLTFPLYLLHFPLLILWTSAIPTKKGNLFQFGVAMISILITIAIIGTYIESKRNWWSEKIGICLVKMKLLIVKVNNSSL